VRCSGLSWPASLREGPALFSLRPEHVRVARAGAAGSDVVRLRGRVVQQAFHGATELIRVECGDGFVLVVRSAGGEAARNEMDLEFSPEDAVLVRESPERS